MKYILMVIFIIIVMSLNFFFSKGVFQKNAEFTKTKEIEQKLKERFVSREKLEEALLNKPMLAFAIFLFMLFGSCIFLIGCVLLVTAIIMKLDKKDILPKPAIVTGRVEWDLLDIFKVVVIFIFFSYILNFFEAIFLGILKIKIEQNARIAANTAIMDITAIGVIFYFVINKYRQKIIKLGLSLKDGLKNAWLGVTGYITIMPLLILVLIAVVSVVNFFGYEPPPQEVVEMFLAAEKTKFLFFLMIMVAIIGPFAEEIFFRGFAYNAIKKKIGFAGALFITSILFAGLHADIVGFFPIFVLGILLAYLYEKTGSLIPSITVHILHNSLTIALVLILKKLAELA